MLPLFLRNNKQWVWFILFLLFGSGAISKSLYADAWQVWLNGGLSAVCLLVFLYYALRKDWAKTTKAVQHKVEQPAATIRNGRLVLLFTGLGSVAAAALIPYVLPLLENGIPLPLPGRIVVTVLQGTVLTFAASAVGLNLASKVRLDAPLLRYWLYGGEKVRVSFRWIGIGALGSFIGTGIIVVLEKFYFQPQFPVSVQESSVALWKGALTFLYGGIVEEVLLRLFVMSLLVWLFTRFGKKTFPLPSFYYIIAIVLSATLFGLAHLPATATHFGGITPLLVARALIGNGLLGMWFGYLYWKKGLEYAMAAHMCGDLFLHLLFAAWLL